MGTLTKKYRRYLALFWAAEAVALLWGLWRRVYIGPTCQMTACLLAAVVLAERDRAAFAEQFRGRYPALYRESERLRGLLGLPRPMKACPVPEDEALRALWAERESGARVSALTLLGALAADMALAVGLVLC